MSRARYPRRHGSYISCEAEVELYVDDVMEQISDKDLIAEMQSRDIGYDDKWKERNAPTIDDLERIVECLRRGWNGEALVRAERMLDAVLRRNIPLSRIAELKAKDPLAAARPDKG